MPVITINYIAVLLAGIASMVIGFLWYSPPLFGKKWEEYMKVDTKEIEQKKKNVNTINIVSNNRLCASNYSL